MLSTLLIVRLVVCDVLFPNTVPSVQDVARTQVLRFITDVTHGLGGHAEQVVPVRLEHLSQPNRARRRDRWKDAA